MFVVKFAYVGGFMYMPFTDILRPSLFPFSDRRIIACGRLRRPLYVLPPTLRRLHSK